MAISRKSIEELTFTTRKGKYYVGEEVDEALDRIADEVELLQNALHMAQAELAEQARHQSERPSMEAYIREQITLSLKGFNEEILAKKEELAALQEEIHALRSQEAQIRSTLRNLLTGAMKAQTELLEQLDGREPASEEASDAPIAIPMPDVQEIANMDIWE